MGPQGPVWPTQETDTTGLSISTTKNMAAANMAENFNMFLQKKGWINLYRTNTQNSTRVSKTEFKDKWKLRDIIYNEQERRELQIRYGTGASTIASFFVSIKNLY